jgi:hypothetical protein
VKFFFLHTDFSLLQKLFSLLHNLTAFAPASRSAVLSGWPAFTLSNIVRFILLVFLELTAVYLLPILIFLWIWLCKWKYLLSYLLIQWHEILALALREELLNVVRSVGFLDILD